MKTKLIIVVCACAFTLTACGNDNPDGSTGGGTSTGGSTIVNADEAAEKGFERIEMRGDVDVYYTQGRSASVRFNDGRPSGVVLECDGRTLVLSNRGSGSSVDAYVTSSRLTGVTVDGPGDFKCDGDISTGTIDITTLSTGDVNLKSLDCDECRATITGEGDIDADRFTADRLIAKTSGPGDINLENVRIDYADCTVESSGDIDLDGYVGRCDRHVTGSGTVDINP